MAILNRLDKMKFDSRLLDLNFKNGIINKKEYEEYLQTLLDDAGNAEDINLDVDSTETPEAPEASEASEASETSETPEISETPAANGLALDSELESAQQSEGLTNGSLSSNGNESYGDVGSDENA